MKNFSFAVLLLCIFTTSNVFAQDQLDGDWSLTRGEIAGEKVTKDILDKMKLKITRGKFDAKSGDSVSKGMISIESRGRGPVQALFKIDNGDDSGREIRALYQLTGNTLKIAFSQSDEYPDGFRSTNSNNVVLLSYKNDKPKTASKLDSRKFPGLPEPTRKSF